MEENKELMMDDVQNEMTEEPKNDIAPTSVEVPEGYVLTHLRDEKVDNALVGLAVIGTSATLYGIYKGAGFIKDKVGSIKAGIGNKSEKPKKKISRRDQKKYEKYRNWIENFEAEHPEEFDDFDEDSLEVNDN